MQQPGAASPPWVFSAIEETTDTVAAVANALSMLFVEGRNAPPGAGHESCRLTRGPLEEAKKELEIEESRIATFKRLHIGELLEQMESTCRRLADEHPAQPGQRRSGQSEGTGVPRSSVSWM
jgi:hypothetical protein